MRPGAQFTGAALAVVACIALAACGLYIPKDFKDAPRPSAATYGEALASIRLDRVNYTLRRGQQVGSTRGGFMITGCGREWTGKPVYWNIGPMTVKDEEFAQIFFEAMKNANYNVVGDPAEMFGDVDGSAKTPDYLVGARVDAVEMDLCDALNPMTMRSLGGQKGSGQVAVTWQIFSTLDRKVVLETKTTGSGMLKEPAADGGEIILGNAFASAAGNLAADPKFHDLLASKQTSTTVNTPIDAPALGVARVAPYAAPISANIDQIERGVVTVIIGDGHGSGFFISPKLVLTNHHVAGGSARVKLRFVDGREVYAKVLRTHPDRDVALLEVEEGSFPALPVRAAPAAITEEVYAIGSPLEESLAGTVTRGIVSQIKTDERGFEFIQADVSIQHGNSGGPLLDKDGNVVGISDMALTDQADSTMGLNFFIPIADALRDLNVTLN